MNNLHRELAPISQGAWSEIEEEARRTFVLRVAGRKVVDVVGPEGTDLSAVGTGHIRPVSAPVDGVLTHEREIRRVIELRVPFTVTRAAVDDVDRGSTDSDWQPVKDAAVLMAQAEDHVIFRGNESLDGIVPSSSNAPVTAPADVVDYPASLAQALTTLRLADVAGPYALILPSDAYTLAAETTDHGYPISEHLSRILGGGDIVWAPAVDEAVVVSRRGGDFTLYLGQDLSIGYRSHDSETIELYLQESFTFGVDTAEASVAINR